MESTSLSFVASVIAPTYDSSVLISNEEESRTVAGVDPFLLEVLENPRHRLTVLRMELDIEKFIKESEEPHFEFQALPSSYLRCAAHRVAQHYGLQTTDYFSSKVIARKTSESGNPCIRLSDIPIKQKEKEREAEQVKVVIRARPNKSSMNGSSENGGRRNVLSSVEERLEKYDKARARIFSGPEKEQCCADAAKDNGGEKEKDSRIAIFRDMEKDRSDPDYDRSYERYSRPFVPCPPDYKPSFLQYDPGFLHMNHFSTLTYAPSSPMIQALPNAVYMHCPTSYQPLYTAPLHHQTLSFQPRQSP